MARSEEVDEAVSAIASAHHWLACSNASPWVAASRSRSARASARNGGALTGATVLALIARP